MNTWTNGTVLRAVANDPSGEFKTGDSATVVRIDPDTSPAQRPEFDKLTLLFASGKTGGEPRRMWDAYFEEDVMATAYSAIKVVQGAQRVVGQGELTFGLTLEPTHIARTLDLILAELYDAHMKRCEKVTVEPLLVEYKHLTGRERPGFM